MEKMKILALARIDCNTNAKNSTYEKRQTSLTQMMNARKNYIRISGQNEDNKTSSDTKSYE